MYLQIVKTYLLYGLCLWQVVPRWHEHWTSNKVYDGDMIVLQGQEKIFLSQSMEGSEDVNKQYTKLTFTPTQADRFVLAFRNWLRRHGNSQPDWFGFSSQQPLPSTVLSKRQVHKTYSVRSLKKPKKNIDIECGPSKYAVAKCVLKGSIMKINVSVSNQKSPHVVSFLTNFLFISWLYSRCWIDLSSTHLSVRHVKERIQHFRHGKSF